MKTATDSMETTKDGRIPEAAAVDPGSGDRVEQKFEQLLDDLFHALNQPLASMRCALELGLYQRWTEDQYRKTLEASLSRLEEVVQFTNGIRALVQAGDLGDKPQVVALDQYLREAVEDWAPVAEQARVRLILQESSFCPVQFEPYRLQQALFHLVEFFVVSAEETTVQIALREESGEAVLSLAVPCQKREFQEGHNGKPGKDRTKLKQQLGLAIAQRMFAAASARWRMENRGQDLRIELRLPLVSRQK